MINLNTNSSGVKILTHKKAGRAAAMLTDFEFAKAIDFGSISPISTRVAKLVTAMISAMTRLPCSLARIIKMLETA
jgi:hypothetical protein